MASVHGINLLCLQGGVEDGTCSNMNKVTERVLPEALPASSKPKLLHSPIDWFKCILCQTSSSEVLQCPALIKRNDVSDDSIATIMPTLERFVILMYDRSNAAECINDARKDLFTRKGRSIDGIPPTQAALLQHTRRTAYQDGYCWGQTLLPSPELPCPSNWGWVKDQDTWEPFWTALAQASESCQELLKCGCSPQIGCRGRCKCIKADLLCTALCLCGGVCDRG